MLICGPKSWKVIWSFRFIKIFFVLSHDWKIYYASFFIGYSGSSGTPVLTNEEKEIIFFAAGVNKKKKKNPDWCLLENCGCTLSEFMTVCSAKKFHFFPLTCLWVSVQFQDLTIYFGLIWNRNNCCCAIAFHICFFFTHISLSSLLSADTFILLGHYVKHTCLLLSVTTHHTIYALISFFWTIDANPP